MSPRTFISGISQQLGQVAELSALAQIGISEEVIAELRRRGFERFLRETNDPAEVWSTCASTAMRQAGITRDDIDFVLMTASSHLIEAALQTLKLAGLGRSTMLGISLQDCCAGIAAIEVGSELASHEDGNRCVLSIIPWYSRDMERLGRNRDIVFSDGTVAFIVSNKEGDFEILAVECSTDPNLVDLERNPSQRATYLLAGLDNIQNVTERALLKAGIGASSLRAVFCTNGNSIFQDAIGMATSTRELIYKDNFSRFGHVLACDELLGLKTFMHERRTYSGDHFLLLSWAPYTTAACVLRCCIPPE